MFALKQKTILKIWIFLTADFVMKMRVSSLCAVEHPQTIACRSGFIIRASVISIATETCKYDESNTVQMAAASSASGSATFQGNNVISTPKIITVRLGKLFKGYKYINKTRGSILKIRFESPYSIPLKPGWLYLLTGYVIDGQLYMNFCSWFQIWSQTTVTQYYGLRRYYWMYCGCKVKYCSDGRCARTLRSCVWHVPNLRTAATKRDCNSRFSICMVRNGRCTWYNPKGGKICPASEIPNIP